MNLVSNHICTQNKYPENAILLLCLSLSQIWALNTHLEYKRSSLTIYSTTVNTESKFIFSDCWTINWLSLPEFQKAFPLFLLTFSVGDAFKWPVQLGALIQSTSCQSGSGPMCHATLRGETGPLLQLKLIENISFHHRLKCCLESLEQSCLENIVEVHRTEKH